MSAHRSVLHLLLWSLDFNFFNHMDRLRYPHLSLTLMSAKDFFWKLHHLKIHDFIMGFSSLCALLCIKWPVSLNIGTKWELLFHRLWINPLRMQLHFSLPTLSFNHHPKLVRFIALHAPVFTRWGKKKKMWVSLLWMSGGKKKNPPLLKAATDCPAIMLSARFWLQI